jgi:hypothetical protein
VQRVQNTDEGSEPKQDDTGREPQASRSHAEITEAEGDVGIVGIGVR